MKLSLKDPKFILVLILVLSTVLRVYNLNQVDVITDESLIAFRAIGPIDFATAGEQTTPWQWFGEVPSWAKWSFHDHPPLVFWLEHLMFSLFGVGLWSLRLFFALAGVASVFLIYLIGKRIFSSPQRKDDTPRHPTGDTPLNRGELMGLIAAGLMAVVSYPVWISRIGLQESIVIFFVLLSFYFFLRALEQKKYLYWLGLAFGLGMLTKYTVIFLLPVFLVYLLIYRRDIFRQKEIWLSVVLSLVAMLPIFVYNIGLYSARGHFDFQLSLLLGQDVPEWKSRLGRELAGTFTDRLTNLLPNLRAGLTPMFFYGSLAAFVWFIIKPPLDTGGGWGSLKRKERQSLNPSVSRLRETPDPLASRGGEKRILPLLAILFLSIELIIIGPTERFLAVLVPFLILVVAWAVVRVYEFSFSLVSSRAESRQVGTKSRDLIPSKYPRGEISPQGRNDSKKQGWFINFTRIFLIVVSVVLLSYEVFFSINTIFTYRPVGPENVTWSQLKGNSWRWGFNELELYLDGELEGRRPGLQFPARFDFLEEIRLKESAKQQSRGLEPRELLIIYDNKMDDLATLWYINRRVVYDGWPAITAKVYTNVLAEQGESFYTDRGVEEFMYITPTEHVLLQPPELWQTDAETMEKDLVGKDIKPEVLYNKIGEDVFRIYKY